MSMQHVSISTGIDTGKALTKSEKLLSLPPDYQEDPEQRPSEPRNRRFRRCTSSDFMSNMGYDSAPESEVIPLSHDGVHQRLKPGYARSRSTGFNSNLVINELTCFASAGESKFERTKASGSKPNDVFGTPSGFFWKVEKKSVLTTCDESSVSYARAGSFLQERYRPSPS